MFDGLWVYFGAVELLLRFRVCCRLVMLLAFLIVNGNVCSQSRGSMRNRSWLNCHLMSMLRTVLSWVDSLMRTLLQFNSRGRLMALLTIRCRWLLQVLRVRAAGHGDSREMLCGACLPRNKLLQRENELIKEMWMEEVRWCEQKQLKLYDVATPRDRPTCSFQSYLELFNNAIVAGLPTSRLAKVIEYSRRKVPM